MPHIQTKTSTKYGPNGEVKISVKQTAYNTDMGDLRGIMSDGMRALESSGGRMRLSIAETYTERPVRETRLVEPPWVDTHTPETAHEYYRERSASQSYRPPPSAIGSHVSGSHVSGRAKDYAPSHVSSQYGQSRSGGPRLLEGPRSTVSSGSRATSRPPASHVSSQSKHRGGSVISSGGQSYASSAASHRVSQWADDVASVTPSDSATNIGNPNRHRKHKSYKPTLQQLSEDVGRGMSEAAGYNGDPRDISALARHREGR